MIAGLTFLRLGEARTVDCSVMRFSAHNQLFYDVVPMSGFYTDDKRTEDLAALVAKILENCAKERV